MPFPTFSRPKRADTFQARMQRARSEGYSRGASEAKLFKFAVGKLFAREQAYDWLSTAIDDGRLELQSQHALEREIEVWDMSCRIAFMVEIT
jgi:myo-inositol catabolism protein IolC